MSVAACPSIVPDAVLSTHSRARVSGPVMLHMLTSLDDISAFGSRWNRWSFMAGGAEAPSFDEVVAFYELPEVKGGIRFFVLEVGNQAVAAGPFWQRGCELKVTGDGARTGRPVAIHPAGRSPTSVERLLDGVLAWCRCHLVHLNLRDSNPGGALAIWDSSDHRGFLRLADTTEDRLYLFPANAWNTLLWSCAHMRVFSRAGRRHLFEACRCFPAL